MFSKKRTVLGFLLALVVGVGILFAAPAFAQEYGSESMETLGELAGFTTDADITVIIARLIRTVITLLGVIVVVLILYGGFVYMTAGGNQDRITKAKKILTNALIGLVLVFASFAIVSFILNALVDATSSSIDTEDVDGDGFGDGDGSSTFYLRSVNTDCSESLQNLELQFVFSYTVDEDTVESGILIEDDGGDAVDGTFDISGRTVTFTPSQACESPYEEYYCFDAESDYTINLDDSELESVSGRSMSCSLDYPCEFEFTTGTGVDIADPTVSMDAPDDDDTIYIGDGNELLQAETTDDTGVSSVYFYVIDDDSAIYTSGTDLSSEGELLGGDEENYFYTDILEEWDPTGYTTNEEYDIWAKGVDCAGNYDVASRIEVTLRAANCNNDVLDADYEDDVDCGGDETSPYYCGACEGGECEEDDDCAEGVCEDGTCVSVPKIETVSPDGGAELSLVTIGGEGFGDEEGTVTFLATESGDEVDVVAYTCNGETMWSDDEIIVQVPDTLTADGPIMVTTADDDPDSDRTDDDYGPTMDDFDLNMIERPGICLLDPDEEQAYEPIDVYGIGFGDTQGTSTFYFTNYEANSYVSWDEELLNVTVPNANAGSYRTSVYTGDYVCVDTLDEPTGDTCSDDDDCDTESGEWCATYWCSETLDYCSDDDDCGDEGGECESIRVGSNEVKFTLEDVSSETVPVISSIDTGWKACEGGDYDGESCGDDDDCEGVEDGTCEDAVNWGPPEQYVTIYGTNFGTAEGYVRLTSQDTDYWGNASTDFPEYCSQDFWHDTYITVIIPEEYQGDWGNIEYTTHDLKVIRQDSEESEPVDIVVLDDDPGPSVCSIYPAAGPAGTEVRVRGERFGSDAGEVAFYDEQDADLDSVVWDTEEISLIPVPDDAATGSMYVVSEEGYESNSITFAVGNCNEDADLCAEGYECCADGSCSDSECLESEEVEAHFSYMISTATIPATPEVVVECDLESDTVSPSVWEGWTDAEDTCLNSVLTAEFDMQMDTDTLVAENMTVEKCILFDEDYDEDYDPNALNDVCIEWEEVEPSDLYSTDYSITWEPPLLTDSLDVDNDGDVGEEISMFEADSWYHITLNGSGDAGAIQAHVDEGGAYMDGDFEWEFQTGEGTDLCEVGEINLTPATHTETTEDGEVDYTAQLIAASDECQVLNCSGYTLTWESDYYGAVIDDLVIDDDCTNVVRAEHETVDSPATITSEVDAINTPSDDAYLTIDFTDPEIIDYFPDCSSACINALPWAQFNTDMDWGTIDESSVILYECEDSLCAPSEVGAFDHVSEIYRNESENRFEIKFVGDYTLTENTYYRIVVDGTEVTSLYDVPLYLSGSNYGSSENLYYENDFSWVFKTKDSSVSCAVDSVALSPDPALMSYVGEREEFNATAYGAEDDCDPDGQALQSSSYDWSEWRAVDTPNTFGVEEYIQTQVVAVMLDDGEIELSNNLPDWCSSACTNVGSAAQEGDAVCGDGEIDPDAEECDDGNTEDEDGCSSSCLFEGTDACTYACVASEESCSSDSDCQEFCEENICSISGDACDDNEDCPYYTDTCAISNAPCCGDGSVETDEEECDDSNSESGDGCSAICLNEGSRSVGATCGDGSIAHADDLGGEDCDDSNREGGDGCSSDCLFEGGISSSDVYAVCGDGTLEDDEGEDCDDGNLVDGDGCSAWCLNEGTEQCVWACEDSGISCTSAADCEVGEDCSELSTPCCGNSNIETGEDCDGGGDGEEGCSNTCLLEGSSVEYTTPSYCGDGDDSGTGEECDVDAAESRVVGGYGVAEVALGASVEIGDDGYSVSTVSVWAGDDDPKEGTATLKLECACETNRSCGEEETLGCGVNNCCFTRPEIDESYPEYNLVGGTPPTEGHCRNTAVYVDFDQPMDTDSFDYSEDADGDGEISADEFDPRFYLDLETWGGVDVEDSGTCPSGYTAVARADVAPQGFFARAWHWIKSKVLGLFGREVVASDTYDCHIPVQFETLDLDGGGQRVYLRYSSLLEEDSIYKLVVKADTNRMDEDHDGVLGESLTDLCVGTKCQYSEEEVSFYVGDEICTLDYIDVEDQGRVDAETYEDVSAQFFTETEEQHSFLATPYTYRTYTANYDEISPISGVYDWIWAWTSSTTDGESADVVSLSDGDAGDDIDALMEAYGNDGDESVIATATVEDYDADTEEENVSGTLSISALLCENPWPALDSDLGFPYIETSENTNFSFYYCRDYGEDGTSDDLAALGDPIEVTSLVSANILQELIFKVEGASDAVGVRVIPNDEYLSPSAWVEAQEFTGDFSETTVDSYDAVESDTTTYVVAANEHDGTLYSNVYIISYNDDASDESAEIFTRILENWIFNANETDISDVNLCKGSNGYITDEEGNYTSCSWDGDCYETCNLDTLYCEDYADAGEECESDSECDSNSCSDNVCTSAVDAGETTADAADCVSGLTYGTCTTTSDACDADADCPLALSGTPTCDAEKAKLTHDMQRLTDITDTITLLEEYGSDNMYCSITKGQVCSDDDSCPDGETCEETYPDVQSGTFVPAISNSIWGSWSSVLANALATTLETDPINKFYNCSITDYDSDSCWNGITGSFVCPEKSLLYGYQSEGGEAYTLYANLEYPDALWDDAIDMDASDNATIVLEYASDLSLTGTPLSGFTGTPQYCDGSAWGTSAICGDGVQGSGEACEIGDTSAGGFCGEADDFSSCTSNADCTLSGVCYTGSCTVYVSDDETYDGIEGCTIDNEYGDGGTCADGTNSYACINDGSSCVWDTSNAAACIAFECGNGVIEGDEICDDGSLNGTYGHCGDDCDGSSEFYCGDGYLAGGEECDCGSTGLYDYTLSGDACHADNDASSWACAPGVCEAANGQYSEDITVSCAFNCASPGPACGDEEINGGEECDGDYETHAGGLCDDGATECDTDSDCDGIGTEVCGASYPACGTGDVCADFDDAGEECDDNGDCDSGTCSNEECSSATDIGYACDSSTAAYTYATGSCESLSCPDADYDLFRYRVCGDSGLDNCLWPTFEDGEWSYCVGGDQQCGNGTVEGNEECDDGNDSNNDYCLNTCELNVCGDDYVYTGSESCDNGDENGELCEADYGSTCNYCNELCQYKTRSGAYCGDGEIQSEGGEVCDGDSIAYYCVDGEGSDMVVSGTCDMEDAGSQGDCDDDYTCRQVGACDGGSSNGEACTHGATIPVDISSDYRGCGAGSSCVMPECADDCGSQCPTSYESIGLLGVTAGSDEYTDSFSLYSYQNDEGDSPDFASLSVPACSVATALTADVSNADVELPDVDIVFVTDLSGSMTWDPTCTSGCSSVDAPGRRIDYVADATADAIEEMLDVYDGVDATMRVGLVSYSGSSTYVTDYAEDDVLEATGSENLSDDESTLLTIVEGYLDEVTGGTPTAHGVEKALDVLAADPDADSIKIIVLLSDGDPTYYLDGSDCDINDYSYTAEDGVSRTAENYAGCAAEVRYDSALIGGHPDTIFYSAVISSSPSLQGYMAHESSEECSGVSMTDASDCGSENYAFAATDEEGIEDMYEAIVDSILNTTVTTTANEEDTTDQVETGEGATLPFPEGFECSSEEQDIPIRNVFYGSGAMGFSNFEFTYCPYVE